MLNAQYTICFVDVYNDYPDVLENLVMSTETRTAMLLKMLKAKFDIFEISGETVPEFKLFLTNKFNQWVDYYEQMLDGYEAEFDWKLGDIEDIDMTYDNDNTRTITPRVKTTTSEFDLPRSTATEERPSSKTVVEPTDGTNEIVDDSTRTEAGTHSRVNLVEQRDKFLKSIRNLYAEFVERFKPCFLDMFM